MGVISAACSAVGSIASGVCSAIGSAAGAIGSFASSCISGVVSAACSVGSSFLSGIASAAGSFVSGLATVVGELAPAVGNLLLGLGFQFVGKVVSALAKMLGITEKEEKPDELGYRIKEAQAHKDWKQREDFDTFEDWNKYLKEKIPEVPSEEINKNWWEYQAIGMGCIYNEINANTEMELPPEFALLIMGNKISKDDAMLILETFQKEGLKGKDIIEYFQKEWTIAATEAMREKLLDAFIEFYPDTSREELGARLDAISTSPSPDVVLKQYKEDFLDTVQNGGQLKEVAIAQGVSEEELNHGAQVVSDLREEDWKRMAREVDKA